MACSLHGYHRPRPLTGEQHHVVPQAWQHFAMTGEVVPETPDARAVASSLALFDPRTVAVAPTCHRNVHHWIVLMMKAGSGEDPAAYVAHLPRRRRTPEQTCAALAVERYVAAGHSLEGLRSQRLYGYA